MYSAITFEESLQSLQTTTQGLSASSIESVRERYGWNELPQKKRSRLLIFLEQFRDIMVYILFIALALSIVMPFLEEGDVHIEGFLDAGVILAILLLNAVLGYVQEFKAEQAIEMLKNLTAPQTLVRRDGKEAYIPSRELLPGDIVLLEAGDKISADGRLIEESHIEVNESALTGESTTVDKCIEELPNAKGIAEQRNMVFSGTIVTRGSGTYVVTAIGLETEIGKIAKMVSETVFPETPLQRRLAHLGKVIGAVVLVLTAIVVVVGLLNDIPLVEVILIGASLAVSAVPEGLPAVVTVGLAIGVRRMVKKNALIRRLDSLETLGSVTVICADKTGTITENRMTVIEAWSKRADDHELLLQIASSCNRAKLPNIGDPTEIGLLQYAEEQGITRLEIDDEVVPFTSEDKYMQTKHGDKEFLKGAPEKICELVGNCEDDVLRQNEEYAKKGLRVLGFAVKENDTFRFVGLIAMEDPPREGAADALLLAKNAGIRTVMITGDNLLTASTIAKRVGIEGDAMLGNDIDDLSDEKLQKTVMHTSVFARVSPAHKVRILTAFQTLGEIVAMSGDGVNDAPALKQAHVGIAMGKNGTEVAREAASMVLADDHYATIVEAVREGRRIYDNIRKFVLFLLRSNFDELLFIVTAIFLGYPLPYLPLHILWINLMTDGLPALALTMEKAEPDTMERPPRPAKEAILSGEWTRLVIAVLLGYGVSIVFFIYNLEYLGLPIEETRTLALMLAITFELCLVFSVRSRKPIWQTGFFSNRWLLGAVAIPFALQFVIVYTPINTLFRLVPVTFIEWLEILGICIASLIFFEALKIFRKN